MGQLWSIHLFWAAPHPVILRNAEALPRRRGSLHSLLYCGTVHVCLCTCVCKIVTFNIFMNKIVENKHREGLRLCFYRQEQVDPGGFHPNSMGVKQTDETHPHVSFICNVRPGQTQTSMFLFNIHLGLLATAANCLCFLCFHTEVKAGTGGRLDSFW